MSFTSVRPGRYRWNGTIWEGYDRISPPPPIAPAHFRLTRTRGTAAGVVAPPSQFVAFAVGAVKPLGYWDELAGFGQRNVGCRIPQSQLTRYPASGTANFTMTPSTNVSGLEIFGMVTGSGGVMRDCIIRGPQNATQILALAQGSGYNFGGALFEWCTFDGSGFEVGNKTWVDGIRGGGYTIRYSEITRVIDGLGAMAFGNATCENSRIVNGYYEIWWNQATGTARPGFPSPPTDGHSHSDGIHMQGYAGWTFRGLNIGGHPGAPGVDWSVNRDPTIPAQRAIADAMDDGLDFQNSCCTLQNNVGIGPGQVVGALIEKCWMEGGTSVIQTNPRSGDDLSGLIIRDITMARRDWTGLYSSNYILKNAAASTFSNIRFADTGALVPGSAA